MKRSFYVTGNITRSVDLIKRNTDWRQLNQICFFNPPERIVLIDCFDRIRGMEVGRIYIDTYFDSLSELEQLKFTERFHHLGMKPEMLFKS